MKRDVKFIDWMLLNHHRVLPLYFCELEFYKCGKHFKGVSN
jgi:hypothetical protein